VANVISQFKQKLAAVLRHSGPSLFLYAILAVSRVSWHVPASPKPKLGQMASRNPPIKFRAGALSMS
jgi:hypothetical protein